jgi:phosphopantothenoylcysteine decarboxylase/phosphopantothenate--cysteine ligase
LTHRPAYTDLFEEEDRVLHVRLARETDLVLVAPATANVIAKMAHGISDDLLSAVLLTATCPVVVAPAMHTEMWEHAATRTNIETLHARGIHIIDPESGELAGGDEGVGRLAEPSTIVADVAATFTHGRDLAGVRFVVTAGGTQEPIDPVRFIGNRSSGKQGFAVAAEAARRGADVTLVSGPTWLDDPDRVAVVRVRTAAEMREAVLARYADADVVVKAAAVADFRPATAADHKIKKEDGAPAIILEPTVDILAELGRTKGRQLLVGFSAETEDAVARARKKLSAKNLDLIVTNIVGRPGSGFEADTNAAVILGADGSEEQLPLQTKASIARAICDRVVQVIRSRNRER